MKGLALVIGVVVLIVIGVQMKVDTSRHDLVHDAVSESLLSEDRPLLFVRNYVETIQEGADTAMYTAFIHPDLRRAAENMPDLLGQLYLNALSENAVLSRANVLTSSVRIEHIDNQTHVFFRLPESLSLSTVYPHSPFAGEASYITDSGRISLAKHHGQWRVVGHSFDAFLLEPSTSSATILSNGME